LKFDGCYHGHADYLLVSSGSGLLTNGVSSSKGVTESVVSDILVAPYNDIEAIKSVAKNNSDIVAVLVEPVQGEGGVIVPDSDYLANIRKICDENNWLMMLDEIQTGTGRTGKWFAHQHSNDDGKGNAKPDVMTLAKALGNGVPIGACLAAGKAKDIFSPGTHGSTFGGNPLATRAGLTVVNIMEKENLCDAATDMGKYFVDSFKQLLGNIDGVVDIRGHGMMIGIELEKDCGELVKQALENQLLINVTAGKTIRLLPPLIFTKEQADTVVSTLVPLIKSFVDQSQDLNP